MSKLSELQAQIAKLQAEADNLLKTEKAAAIASIKMQMAEMNITMRDLGESTRSPRAKTVVDAKFKDPASGKTWTGRGRRPAWMGKDDTKYLIK